MYKIYRMKLGVLVWMVLLVFQLKAQINIKSIDYEVELIDPLTGVKPEIPGVGIDWEFEVFFNDSIVGLKRKFALNYSERRIINKNQNEVLYMLGSSQDSTFFFTTISKMLDMDMSSNYGETIISVTKERKNILGFDCNKIEMNFGEQAKAVLWVTEKIFSRVIIPETPFASKYVALECIFEDPGLTVVYKAKKIEETVISKEWYSILKGYKLIVPVSEFDVSGLFPRDGQDFSFVHYPSYPKGKEQFHEDIRSLCKLKPKVDDPIGEFYDVYINFTVNTDGTLSRIKISGIDDNEYEKVQKMLLNTKLNPANVKGEKVMSNVTVSVNLNKR